MLPETCSKIKKQKFYPRYLFVPKSTIRMCSFAYAKKVYLQLGIRYTASENKQTSKYGKTCNKGCYQVNGPEAKPQLAK